MWNSFGTGLMNMIIGQVLFFIITTGLIIWFVKNIKLTNNPKEILDNRLALGEITKEEYELLLKTIKTK